MANELSIIVSSVDKASGVLEGISGKIEGMGKKMQKTGLLMIGAGTAIVGALVGITMKTAQAGDEIAKMSKRTGLGTVALSELKYAADLSGTSLEGLETGIKRMQMVLVDASNGMESAIGSLDSLGLSVVDLMGLSPEEQFTKLAGAIAEIEDPTIRAAVAQEIFGRSGTDLLPMLAEGATGLEKMRQEAHELGVVFDEEAAKKAEAFQDAITKLKTSFEKAGASIGEALMPILTDLLENKIIPIIQNIAAWIGENEELVITLLKIGGMLIAGGIILVGLANVAKAITMINAAIIIMHGLAGPAGWIALAAGIAIAAGAIIGIQQLMKGIETPAIPGAQAGGIVRRPTFLHVGEAGPEAIVPLPNNLGAQNVYVTVEGSVIAERDLTNIIYEQLLQRKSRNVSLELT